MVDEARVVRGAVGARSKQRERFTLRQVYSEPWLPTIGQSGGSLSGIS
jgi:hypothetical protein